MKLTKIDNELYQVSVTYANAVYSELCLENEWAQVGSRMIAELRAGTYEC
ncbi:hypothetical protein RRL34_004255 [Vibrio parahaemolyticus]|nr:hypothetical protein [Vibrio parahaemolyticus]